MYRIGRTNITYHYPKIGKVINYLEKTNTYVLLTGCRQLRYFKTERKPLEFLLQYFIDNPNWQITGDYKGLTVSKDNMGNIIYEKKTTNTAYITIPFSIMILEDLLVWMDLASYFDEDNYKVCKVEHNGKIEEITYFDSYIYYQSKDDKLPYWKKVKKPVKG